MDQLIYSDTSFNALFSIALGFLIFLIAFLISKLISKKITKDSITDSANTTWKKRNFLSLSLVLILLVSIGLPMYLFNTSLKGVNQITVSKDGIISKRFGFKKSYVWKDIRSITIKVVPHTNLPLGRSQTSPMCNGVTTEIDANPTNDLPLTLKIDEVFQLADRTYSIDASPVRADIVDLVRLTHGQKVAFTVIPPEEISPSDTDLCLQQGFLVNTAFVELKALFKSYGF